MNIVMPMAGRGSRFADVGVRVPKPLIDVLGRPMYSWAMDGLPLDLASRVIFLCLREHLADGSLEGDIRSRYPDLETVIVPVDTITEGQACTVLLARKWIDSSEPLLIFNADTYCPSTIGRLLSGSRSLADGVLDVFRAEGEKWSFARTDDRGRVLETAEKRRISEWASTGLYYFRRGHDFVQYAEAMMAAKERQNGEYYVAPVYNRMIAAGADVHINPVQNVWALGTPEELARFLREYPG